jgi:hypothetical protein
MPSIGVIVTVCPPLCRSASKTVFVAIRHFVSEPNDPLEGRHVRVLLAGADGRRVTLADDCFGVGHPVHSGALIAFDCVRESVADQQLLHATEVVDYMGRFLKEIRRCRQLRVDCADAVAL